MIFADLDLARRLEGLETWVAAEYAGPGWPSGRRRTTAVVAVAGGVACLPRRGSPLNEAKGMGWPGRSRRRSWRRWSGSSSTGACRPR